MQHWADGSLLAQHGAFLRLDIPLIIQRNIRPMLQRQQQQVISKRRLSCGYNVMCGCMDGGIFHPTSPYSVFYLEGRAAGGDLWNSVSFPAAAGDNGTCMT